METTNNVPKAKQWFWIGIGLLVAWLYFWHLAPDTFLGIDTGWIGSLLMPFGVWSTLYGLAHTRTNPESLVSFGEKQTIISLVITVTIALYFFVTLASMGWNINIHSRETGRMVTNIVLMLVGTSIITTIMRERERGMVVEDERDNAIQQRAASMSHGLLIACLLLVIVFVGFNPPARIAWATPVVIAHSLLGILMTTEIVRYGYQWWLYRRERA